MQSAPHLERSPRRISRNEKQYILEKREGGLEPARVISGKVSDIALYKLNEEDEQVENPGVY